MGNQGPQGITPDSHTSSAQFAQPIRPTHKVSGRTLSPAVIMTKGMGSEELGTLHEKAIALASATGNQDQSFRALFGSWMSQIQRPPMAGAKRAAARLGEIARDTGESGHQLQAHHALWTTAFFLGDVATAHHHMQEGSRLYDIHEHGNHANIYGGHDPGSCALNFDSMCLWLLGYPDQSNRRSLPTSLRHVSNLWNFCGGGLVKTDDRKREAMTLQEMGGSGPGGRARRRDEPPGPEPATRGQRRTRRSWPSRSRRKFTAQYRLRILEEAESCTQPGEVCRLLRRKGLYSSRDLTEWRMARREGSHSRPDPEQTRSEARRAQPLSAKGTSSRRIGTCQRL